MLWKVVCARDDVVLAQLWHIYILLHLTLFFNSIQDKTNLIMRIYIWNKNLAHCLLPDTNIHIFGNAHLKKVHSEWCSKPLSEFGQKLIPGSRRAANYTLISLLDDRRRHGDHILGTMHTKRGFCLGWLNMDTFLEKCEGGVSGSRKKNSVLKSYI